MNTFQENKNIHTNLYPNISHNLISQQLLKKHVSLQQQSPQITQGENNLEPNIPLEPSLQQQHPSVQPPQVDNILENSNKLKNEEREMIIQFLKGNKNNPFPQYGPVIQILLNEVIYNSENNKCIVEQLIFEINYDTGNWKKLKRKKAVPKEQINSIIQPNSLISLNSLEKLNLIKKELNLS